MSDGEELRRQIRAEQTLVSSVDQKLSRLIEEEKERNRSRLSGRIVYTFCFVIVFTVLVLGWLMYARAYLDIPQERISNALEIAAVIQTFAQNSLVPIVTFVLGFYFGSSKRDS